MPGSSGWEMTPMGLRMQAVPMGLYLNGQKLKRGDLHPLHNGDWIQLGEAVLLFRKQGEADIWNRVVFYPTGDV